MHTVHCYATLIFQDEILLKRTNFIDSHKKAYHWIRLFVLSMFAVLLCIRQGHMMSGAGLETCATIIAHYLTVGGVWEGIYCTQLIETL